MGAFSSAFSTTAFGDFSSETGFGGWGVVWTGGVTWKEFSPLQGL